MHPRKIIPGFVMAAMVVLLALGLAANRPSAAVANTTTSQTAGSPIGELSGGYYRLISVQPAPAQMPTDVLLGGGYSLRSLSMLDDMSGCCCKTYLPCAIK